ncbi:MAG: hypothetical protein HQL17_00475 [Candidatus Omnitrophica bacterium]|nr:hypothetical protein [Candidatus Omnitrophota bacterium]
MKYLAVYLLVVLSVSGCSMVSTSIAPAVVAARPVDRLTLGMTRSEALAIMDAKVVVGYDVDQVSGVSKPIETKSLYSSEMTDINGVAYQVDRYIVRPPASMRMAESELYPVVYKDGFLAAKGYDGLAGLKAGK